MPRLPTLEDWQRQGRHIEVFGHRIFVVEAGSVDAPPIVVLHGYPTSSHDYASVLAALSAHHRVVVHDHLGFGLSAKPPGVAYALQEQAEVALALWRSLGIHRAHVVAHDYGTSVATEIMARSQRLGIDLDVATLTLCNGSIHLDLARPRTIQKLPKHPTTGPWVARFASAATFRRNLRAILARPDAVHADDLATMWSLLTRDGGRAVLPQITGYLDERMRFRDRWIGALTRLDRPCHVLWGTADPVARMAVARALVDEIPGARLTRLEGVGHYPMVEAPEAWGAAVLGFVDDPAGGSAVSHTVAEAGLARE